MSKEASAKHFKLHKKHWCTHQSYGPKKFPREQTKRVFSILIGQLGKKTVVFRGDPLFKRNG